MDQVQLGNAEIEEIKKAVLIAAASGHQVGGLAEVLMRELRELKSSAEKGDGPAV